MSTDGGGTYLPAQTVTNPAAIGGATTVPGDATTTLVDRGNTVNIVLTQGTLQSDTEQNVFAGKNAAALGAEGRWEIIQWETATLELMPGAGHAVWIDDPDHAAKATRRFLGS